MISIKTKSDFTIRLANENDTLSITNIWRECFTSDLSYIDNFIINCFPHSKTWIAISQKSSEAVAVLSLFPSYFYSDGQYFSGGYIYGVATLPDYRGNSLSSLLMNTAFDYSLATKLQYLVVKPANDGLFDLYRRQSFDILINKQVFSVDLHSDNYLNLNFTPNRYKHNSIFVNKSNESIDDVEKVYHLREKNKNNTDLLWPLPILRYALLDNYNKGGSLNFVSNIGNHSELYYIEQPDEFDSETIKVIDCNYKEKRDLYTIISFIESLHKEVKKVVFEGNFHSLSPLPFSVIKTKSALIKLLDNKIDPECFSKIHLSLPME
ncbi:MAG: GNAT family N-acetyltransferase [Bacteroidales bacterium]